jgi:hypothetical protein
MLCLLFLLERLRNRHHAPDDLTSVSSASPASLPGAPGTPISGLGVFTERCRRPKLPLPLPLPPASVRCAAASLSPVLASARACAPQKSGFSGGQSVAVLVGLREWALESAGALQTVAYLHAHSKAEVGPDLSQGVKSDDQGSRVYLPARSWTRARGPCVCCNAPHSGWLPEGITPPRRTGSGALDQIPRMDDDDARPLVRPGSMLRPRPRPAIQPAGATVKSQPPYRPWAGRPHRPMCVAVVVRPASPAGWTSLNPPLPPDIPHVHILAPVLPLTRRVGDASVRTERTRTGGAHASREGKAERPTFCAASLKPLIW